MKFMVLVKANAQTEAGEMPTEKDLSEMGKYNEALVNAGIMLGGDGIHPSSKGARVNFSGGKATVTDGPFAEARELIAGYWIWECKSKQEAVDWARRAPMAEGDQLEIRQIFSAEDFGAEYTPELQERDARLRAQVSANQ